VIHPRGVRTFPGIVSLLSAIPDEIADEIKMNPEEMNAAWVEMRSQFKDFIPEYYRLPKPVKNPHLVKQDGPITTELMNQNMEKLYPELVENVPQAQINGIAFGEFHKKLNGKSIVGVTILVENEESLKQVEAYLRKTRDGQMLHFGWPVEIQIDGEYRLQNRE
jgi:hypothetical protein